MSWLDHPDVDDLLRLTRLLGAGLDRDFGLLEAASPRPRAIVFVDRAYPTLGPKAALLHLLVRSRARVDGNERLAWLATVVDTDLNVCAVDLDDAAGFDRAVRQTASSTLEPQLRCRNDWAWDYCLTRRRHVRCGGHGDQCPSRSTKP